ncbi:MAG: Uma2 family endonuclease, partial [Thermoanaerobaculia bacterium]
ACRVEVMASRPDLTESFRAMEALVEAQPEGVQAEIARGVYMMSPRPSVKHGHTQIRLASLLDEQLGRREPPEVSDWFFLVEPEIRSEAALSRLIPDVAGWRRSTGGWPNPEENPIALAPEWVAEVLSPNTEDFDRGPKKDAYGWMGVGWLWLIDVERRRIETFANQRGRMVAGPTLSSADSLGIEPFSSFAVSADAIFLR